MFTSLWTIIKATFRNFLDDDATQIAAALAFYTIFALGPMLLIIVAVAGFVWGEDAARGRLVEHISKSVGEGPAQQIQQVIAAARQSKGGELATALGGITLLLGATGLFGQLRQALNRIWGIQPVKQSAIASLLKGRVLAFGLVIAIAVLLLVSVAATTALAAFSSRLGGSVPVPIIQILEFVISWIMMTFLFAAVFKWLPDAHIPWRDVLAGGAVTAVLFTVGKIVLGWYLARGSVSSVYGAAGSLVVILLWVYYSSIIYLVGAEFTQVFTCWRDPDASVCAERRKEGEREPEKRKDSQPAGREEAARPPREIARPRAGQPVQPARHESPADRLLREISAPVANFLVDVLEERFTSRKRKRAEQRRETGPRGERLQQEPRDRLITIEESEAT